MPVAFRLRGDLKRDSLSEAVRHVVSHHENLRAEIVDNEQKVRSSAEFEPQWHDLSSLNKDERSLHDEIISCIQRFRLREELPFRANIFKIAKDDHVILLDLHHVFGDMTSMQLIFQRLGDIYSDLVTNGNVRPIPKASGGANETKEEFGDSGKNFWREQLRDIPLDVELPLARARPRLPSFAGDVVYGVVPKETAALVKAAARTSKCSIFTFLLAAFQVLVHRYSGHPTFSIGVPFSLRTEPGMEEEVDYLVNLLPFPCAISRTEKFSTLVDRVRMTTMTLFQHLHSSLPEILKALEIPIDNPKPPLTRIVFQYFPEMPKLRMAGLTAEPFRIHSRTSKFDLCVTVSEENETFTTEFEFDTDIFEGETVQRYARAYECLLKNLPTGIEKEIGELNLIPVEDHRLLELWSGEEVPYPKQSVPDLFDEVANQRPNAVALLFDDQKISYVELQELSNRFAGTLIDHGIKRGEMVGVCMQRSPELVAALLGIMKAGAAFVPFDSKYPRARLDYLFKDSSVRLLIADEQGRSIAPEGVKTLSVSEVRTGRIPSRAAAAGPEDIAYMMYTSGSTGMPKGVTIPHRAIVRLVRNNTFISIQHQDVFLAFAPVSFDASTLEIWGPLLNGATLAIYPPEFESLEQFESVLRKRSVTCLWLTAGLFNAVVNKNVHALRGVRRLLVGGDVLSAAHINKAISNLPGTELINGYGPTENTTFTCCYRIPKDQPVPSNISIGRPIRNTKVHILDEALRPVPIGAEGELYAGGDGLSLGYWNKPELTASSFVQNPENPTSKLYRTGDRARFRADGNIEFLGRKDFQVKIRGFRVELGEIEAALRSLSKIRDAVVCVLSEQNGGKNLVGYVVPDVMGGITAEEVIEQLEKTLPSHACPKMIVFLEQLPIGPNGKIDRRVLPKPELSVASPEFAAPSNSTEARLLKIWESILEMDALGVDANFFHSGGESLKATRAVTQINQAFRCNLTVPQLFLAPTVREMARVVAGANAINRVPRITRRTQPWEKDDFKIDTVSDEQVDTLLKKLLDGHVGA